jgi:hypothetical protein
MKESYGEGLTSHTGPEPCVGVRKGACEALGRGGAGQVCSRERTVLRDADAVEEGGRPHPERRYRETLGSPARSKTLGTHRGTSRENRESPCAPVGDGPTGRVGKSAD